MLNVSTHHRLYRILWGIDPWQNSPLQRVFQNLPMTVGQSCQKQIIDPLTRPGAIFAAIHPPFHNLSPPLPSVPLQTPDKSVFYFHSCALGNHITRHLHKEFHTVHPKAGEIWWHHLICDQLASQESECQKQSTNHVLLLKRNIFEREKNTCAKWLFGWPPRNLLHFQYYGALFDL